MTHSCVQWQGLSWTVLLLPRGTWWSLCGSPCYSLIVRPPPEDMGPGPLGSVEACDTGCSQLMPSPLRFRASLEASAGHKSPSGTNSDGNKKRRGSITSALGLKKLFSALGHTPRPRLGPSRSYSVEQLQPSALAPQTSTSKVKRAPSLQTLHLVSPQGPGHQGVVPVVCSNGMRVEGEVSPGHSSGSH